MTTHARRFGDVTKVLAVAMAVVGGGLVGAGPAEAAGGAPPTISIEQGVGGERGSRVAPVHRGTSSPGRIASRVPCRDERGKREDVGGEG